MKTLARMRLNGPAGIIAAVVLADVEVLAEAEGRVVADRVAAVAVGLVAAVAVGLVVAAAAVEDLVVDSGESSEERISELLINLKIRIFCHAFDAQKSQVSQNPARESCRECATWNQSKLR